MTIGTSPAVRGPLLLFAAVAVFGTLVPSIGSVVVHPSPP
ncbi:hypothetical protein DFR67_101448 [Williamsia limnetica]|jgi:hypothetical protein|uniref:Uncharacterized protein n=1 Tax=Williamsia limnetica TaxID=882452 RepID=A0A318S8F1_WILLI|nr:hypothetical protein DFR67_101448 [Williamsia limnetica]